MELVSACAVAVAEATNVTTVAKANAPSVALVIFAIRLRPTIFSSYLSAHEGSAAVTSSTYRYKQPVKHVLTSRMTTDAA
jgi:hypothetical protein